MRHHTWSLCLWAIIFIGTIQESSPLQCYSPVLDGNKVTHQSTKCQQKYQNTLTIQHHNGTTSQINVTSSLQHPEFNSQNMTDEDFLHCLVFQYLSPNQTDERGCDHDFLCDNSLLMDGSDSTHLVEYSGSRSFLYCCTEDNCNTEDKLQEIQKTPPRLPCTEDAYAGSQMIVTRSLISKPHYAAVVLYTCDEDEDICKANNLGPNQCTNVTEWKGQTVEPTRLCCCDSMSCNHGNTHPSTTTTSPGSSSSTSTEPLPTGPLGPMPSPDSGKQMKWKFMAGIGCALLLAFLVFVIIGVVIKKYRARKSGPLAYSYNELTAELAEEREIEDDYMIVA